MGTRWELNSKIIITSDDNLDETERAEIALALEAYLNTNAAYAYVKKTKKIGAMSCEMAAVEREKTTKIYLRMHAGPGRKV